MISCPKELIEFFLKQGLQLNEKQLNFLLEEENSCLAFLGLDGKVSVNVGLHQKAQRRRERQMMTFC
jgi:hypothetical protein